MDEALRDGYEHQIRDLLERARHAEGARDAYRVVVAIYRATVGAIENRALKAEAERDSWREKVEHGIAAYGERTTELIAAHKRIEELAGLVGEGGSARPSPDPTATREYGTDDGYEGCIHNSPPGPCAQCEAMIEAMHKRDHDIVKRAVVDADKEEGLLQAEDHITAAMREHNCTFAEAVKYLALKQHFAPNPTHTNSWCPPSETVYSAEIDRLQAALAEKRRGE